MKNSCKRFVGALLLVLIALALVGGGVYVYTQKKQKEQPSSTTETTTSTSSQTSTSSSAPLPVAEHILLNAYNNPTDYEKSLIGRMSQLFGLDNLYVLKYYDDKTVVFIIAPPKDGAASLDIYNISTLENISSRSIPVFSNYIESDSYIIATDILNNGGESLLFYKKGAQDFQIIPNSTLSASETYVKGSEGMGSYVYDFTFDEPTKTLTASIFKPTNSLEHPKIRTVKFVLP